LEEAVLRRGQPFLGICVGMQLMAKHGREHGTHEGLAWLAGEVFPLVPKTEPGAAALKVPHMGWNDISILDQDHPVLDGFGRRPHFYFVHSYHFRPENPKDMLAAFDYGGRRPSTMVGASQRSSGETISSAHSFIQKKVKRPVLGSSAIS
jgi:glutamine amidotransferase